MAHASTHHERHRHYKYYDLCMVGFVTVLLCSNLIGPGKVCQFTLPFTLPWGSNTLTFGAGNIFFPIGYIFGDVLTEVYGYARARKVIWAGFAAMSFASVMSYIILALPPKPDEPFNQSLQPALETVFNGTWRITTASLIAYWVGDFANSFVLAKMKLLTNGNYLWTRTIGSTIVGQGVDSIIFYPLAFFGLWTGTAMLSVIIFNWLFKTTVEIVMTPITYTVVNYLKRAERENFFDYDTNFTPFSLED